MTQFCRERLKRFYPNYVTAMKKKVLTIMNNMLLLDKSRLNVLAYEFGLLLQPKHNCLRGNFCT
jgi:hypothetical protein